MHMPRQPELPGIPPKPKRSYVLRAHQCDLGEGHGDFPYIAMFRRHRRVWESVWLMFQNKSEIRMGISCPDCNIEQTEEL